MEQLEIVFNVDSADPGEKFGLIWEESENDELIVRKCRELFPAFQPVKSLDILTNPTLPVNMIIEGDNYQALYILNYTHQNKIDAIYIDPPYNSGKATLKYKDKFYQKEHQYRHSKWLAFMYNRLQLCQNLLTDDGVIFISIDDREMAHLKLLCDKIFGEQNFMGNFIWINRTTPNDASNKFTVDHEYILLYARQRENFKFQGIEKNLSKYINRDDDPNGPWAPDNPSAASGTEKDRFPIENPFTKEKYFPPNGRYWAFSKKRVNEWFASGKLVFPKETGKNFLLKKYLNELKSDKKPASSIIAGILTGQGTKELKQIFKEGSPLKYPKPLGLIKYLLGLLDKQNGCYLDFFAGSGTTGQAVLELNQEDGGKRQFILCNNNENNLCREVLYHRIKKNLQGYQYDGSEKEILFRHTLTLHSLKKADNVIRKMEALAQEVAPQYHKLKRSFKDNTLTLTGIKQKPAEIAGLPGNVKYYKSYFLNTSPKNKALQHIIEVCTEMICFMENTFQPLISGINYKVYGNQNIAVAIYFDLPNSRVKEIVDFLKQIESAKKIYLFSIDNTAVLARKFSDCTIEIVPAKILNIYKKLYR